jgi:hypothetical protein
MLFENHPELNDYQRDWVAAHRKPATITLRVWAYGIIIYTIQAWAGAYLWSEPLHAEWSLFAARLGAFAVVLAVMLRFIATLLYIPLFILAITFERSIKNKELKQKIAPQIVTLLTVFNPKRTFVGWVFLLIGYLLDWFVFIGLIVGNHPIWAGLFLLSAVISQLMAFMSRLSTIEFLKSLTPEGEEINA